MYTESHSMEPFESGFFHCHLQFIHVVICKSRCILLLSSSPQYEQIPVCSLTREGIIGVFQFVAIINKVLHQSCRGF